MPVEVMVEGERRGGVPHVVVLGALPLLEGVLKREREDEEIIPPHLFFLREERRTRRTRRTRMRTSRT